MQTGCDKTSARGQMKMINKFEERDSIESVENVVKKLLDGSVSKPAFNEKFPNL